MIKDIARATSAAPTYFQAATIKDQLGIGSHTYVDGGMYANDPTYEAVRAANRDDPNCDFYIVSIGTGEEPRKFGDLSLADAGLIKWGQSITDEMLRLSQDKHLLYLKDLGNNMRQSGRKVIYHRLQLVLPESLVAMDDISHAQGLFDAGNFVVNPQNPEGTYEKVEAIVEALKKLKELSSFSGGETPMAFSIETARYMK